MESLHTKPQLQAIGLGHARTGTTSLQNAFEQLGFSPCYYIRRNIVKESFPYYNGRSWQRIFAETDKHKRQAQIRQLYERGGFKAAIAFPTFMFAEDLVEMYPDAKFILSLSKSPQSWRISFNNTVGNFTNPVFTALTCLLPWRWASMAPLMSFWDETNAVRYNGARIFRSDSVDVYERHNEWVKKVVPPEKLLVHEASQGWEPICRFIGVEVPDGPYPHVNDTKKMKKDFLIVASEGVMLWVLLGTFSFWAWRRTRS